MTDDRGRELLALRLYGELDADEARELDALLAADAALRDYADALAAGLGRVPRLAPPEAPAFVAPPHERRRWLPLAAAFAAGVLVTLVVDALRPPAAPAPRPDGPAAFGRDTPPVEAPVTGRFARLLRASR